MSKSIQSAAKLYNDAQLTHAKEVAELQETIATALQRIEPTHEWEFYKSRDDTTLIDPNTPLRSVDAISFPGQGHASTSVLKEGFIERKKRFSKKYTESYYVLTPSGYLHERKSSCVARPPPPPSPLPPPSTDPCLYLLPSSPPPRVYAILPTAVVPRRRLRRRSNAQETSAPAFSLFLPECSLSAPSKEKDRSHKLHVEGNKVSIPTFSGKRGALRAQVDRQWADGLTYATGTPLLVRVAHEELAQVRRQGGASPPTVGV